MQIIDPQTIGMALRKSALRGKLLSLRFEGAFLPTA